jgi:hypothetical protein
MIMNKIHKINAGFLFFSIAMALILVMSACKKNIEQNPVITGVVNYVASPNDTALHSLVADGQWVVITGKNLQSAIQIKFNGVPAFFNATLFSNNSAVVQIPPMQFSTIDPTKLYTIEYTTTTGTTTFSFKLGPDVPVISAISNVFANPGDSVFLYGTNLVLVESLNYAGNAIAKTVSNLDGTSLGFLMPAQTPTDQVLLITKGGRDTFKIVATPTITAISNENANTGDSVYVYGTYLKNIQAFTFSGATITSFVTSSDASFVGFKLPSLSQSGPASITTVYGTATTVYDVNNMYDVKYRNSPTTGVLGNFEWGDAFGWQWWGGCSLSVSDPGQTYGWLTLCPEMTSQSGGMFISIKQGPLAAGASNNHIPIGDALWVPAANLNDTVGNWALKFEMNIPNGWNGGSLRIKPGFTDSYIALYEPWKTSSTATSAFTTKGWRTVTIPLSRFLKADLTLGEGRGAPVTSISNLLGPGKTGLNVTIKNYAASATSTGFYGGFDNFRVVKIK